MRLAPPKAELIYAGKRGGSEKTIEQSEMNAMLIEHARKGRVVVRLKGGDPFIFGRGGEEAEALARAKVDVRSGAGRHLGDRGAGVRGHAFDTSRARLVRRVRHRP